VRGCCGGRQVRAEKPLSRNAENCASLGDALLLLLMLLVLLMWKQLLRRR